MIKTMMTVTLIDNSDILKEATKEQIAKALTEAGAVGSGYALLLAPKKTGNLQNSYNGGYKVDGNTVYIGTDVEYAKYVELGTSRMEARPHLEPAITGHIEEYKQIILDHLKQ